MVEAMRDHIAILGAGAWGTALAMQAERAGQRAMLWARDPARAALIQQSRANERLLPGVALPAGIAITADAARAWVEAIRKGLENPTFRQRLLDSGLTPNFEDTVSFNHRIANDLKSWGDVIRAAGIKAD